MTSTIETISSPIETWFGVGGGAERYFEPQSEAQLLEAVRADSNLRVLGDGANLLVDDRGVTELVVRLRGEAASWTIDEQTGIVRVGAGANLPKLILATVRAGLSGLETLGGVPATVGGAIAMNAGGRYGEIASVVGRVRAVSRDGQIRELEPSDLSFGYREARLDGAIVSSVELRLQPGCDPSAVRQALKNIMADKKASQPLAASSCGCVFRNPTLVSDLPELGLAGDRISAGMLIDQAGGKGMSSQAGGVRVSEVHANFFETAPQATASEVIELIARVQELVAARFGVELKPELVLWRREQR